MEIIFTAISIFIVCLISHYVSYYVINKFSKFKVKRNDFIGYFIAIFFTAFYIIMMLFY